MLNTGTGSRVPKMQRYTEGGLLHLDASMHVLAEAGEYTFPAPASGDFSSCFVLAEKGATVVCPCGSLELDEGSMVQAVYAQGCWAFFRSSRLDVAEEKPKKKATKKKVSAKAEK